MSDLTNKTVASTYKDLIHLGNGNDGLNAEFDDLVVLHDGAGEALPITVSHNQIHLGMDNGSGAVSTPTLTVDVSAKDVEIHAMPEDVAIFALSGKVVNVGQIMLSGSKVDTSTFADLDDSGVHVVQHCGHMLPETTTSYDLGAPTRRYGSAYVDRVVHGHELITLDSSMTVVATDVLVTEVQGTVEAGGALQLPSGTAGQEKIIVLPAHDYTQGSAETSHNFEIESAEGAVITALTVDTDESASRKVIHLVCLSTGNDWIQIN